MVKFRLKRPPRKPVREQLERFIEAEDVNLQQLLDKVDSLGLDYKDVHLEFDDCTELFRAIYYIPESDVTYQSKVRLYEEEMKPYVAWVKANSTKVAHSVFSAIYKELLYL